MIADTSLLIDLMRGEQAAAKRIRGIEEGAGLLWIPAPVIFELFEGIERSSNPPKEGRRVEAVLEDYTVIPLDLGHAKRAGAVSGRLIREGNMIEPLDAQIAGIALEEGMPVLARNVDDYERVPGLDVETY